MFLSRLKVAGHSMEPAFKNGNIVFASSFPYVFINPKVGDVIVLKKEKFIIKRIKKTKGDKLFVQGDNLIASLDSRDFGWINKREIIGKVIYKI